MIKKFDILKLNPLKYDGLIRVEVKRLLNDTEFEVSVRNSRNIKHHISFEYIKMSVNDIFEIVGNEKENRRNSRNRGFCYNDFPETMAMD